MSVTGSGFRDSVQAARERWQQGRDKLRTLHEDGAPGRRVVNALSDLLDHVLLGLYRSCLDDFSPEIGANVSFILHGGCGRREVISFILAHILVWIVRSHQKLLTPRQQALD